MKIDFSQMLMGLDGEVLRSPPIKAGEEGKPQTLGRVCIDALVSVERNATPDGKVSFERYTLAAKINDKKEVEVSAEEIVALKDRVGKVFGPIVVGPAFILLEGKKVGK